MITSTPRTPGDSDTTCTMYGRIELTRVDDNCWRLCDRTLPHTDPSRVIALAKMTSEQVTVLWVRERDKRDQFATLEQALKATEDSIYDLEDERADGPTAIPHFPPPA